MNLVRSVTLPNGQETRTTAFPIQMTGYDFEIFRDPPKLGAHNDDVVADWLSAEDLR
jgi:crotonobetainyl-CoA:carnitine CoA-transferase CaiB-like acyl-CoA transferase